MYCQGYTTIRRKLHSHILNADARYTSLSDNDRTKYLFRADNKDTSKENTSIQCFKNEKGLLIHQCN